MHVHANIESLSWESEFFRLNSAKLYFNETAERLTEADLNAFERVQAKVPAHRLELVDALSALGFRLVEGEVKLSLNIAAEPTATQTAPLPGVRMATPKDIPQLRTSAAKVFATSRFRAPWYDSADCARFYAVWIEKPSWDGLTTSACWRSTIRDNQLALSVCGISRFKRRASACWRHIRGEQARGLAQG